MAKTDSQYVLTMKAGLMDIMTEHGWLKLYPKMEGAIDSIVRNAEKNKAYLRSILSHHPDWSPYDEAVVFNIDDMVPKLNLSDAIYSYFELAHYHVRNKPDRVYQLNTLKHIASKKLFDVEGKLTSESSVLLGLVGIREIAGKKYSRALRAWGDSIEGLKSHPSYERHYAQLSDAICPTFVKRKSVISINPLHFTLMSNGNSWTSCHTVIKSVRNDARPGGPFAFAQDSTSILFYTLDENCTEIIKCPKITRQMFHYHGGTLIQSKQFPKGECVETNTAYRRIVQSVIADSLNLSRPEGTPEIANKWKTEKTCKHWTEPEGGFHYPDYDRREAGEYGTTSFLTGVTPPDAPAVVDIGHACFCFKCAQPSKTHQCGRC